MPAPPPPATPRRPARPALLAAARRASWLAAALLATPVAAAPPAPGPAPLRVDCRATAGRLVAELDLSPAIDAGLEERLGSGLASTVRLTVAALGPDDLAAVRAERQFEVRLDVWTEVFTVTIREQGGQASARQASDWAAVRSLLAHPGAFDLGPLSGLPERFSVEARLELDPVTAPQLERIREQLTHPAGTRSLLGTLAAVLLRAPPPAAGRYRSAPLTRAGVGAP